MKSQLEIAKDNIKISYYQEIKGIIERKVPYMLNYYLETFIVDSYIYFSEIHLDIVKEVIKELEKEKYFSYESKETKQWIENLSISCFEQKMDKTWKFTEETLSTKPKFIFK